MASSLVVQGSTKPASETRSRLFRSWRVLWRDHDAAYQRNGKPFTVNTFAPEHDPDVSHATSQWFVARTMIATLFSSRQRPDCRTLSRPLTLRHVQCLRTVSLSRSGSDGALSLPTRPGKTRAIFC